MVDLSQFMGLFGVFEAHAMVFGVVFLVAGFFLGLLHRITAFIVLGLALFSSGSVILSALSQYQQGTTPTAIGVALAAVSVYSVYRSAKLVLTVAEFVMFFAAWFLVLYGALGVGFTNSVVDLALWLVAGAMSLFLTHRATALLGGLHPSLKTHASWNPPAAVTSLPVPLQVPKP